MTGKRIDTKGLKGIAWVRDRSRVTVVHPIAGYFGGGRRTSYDLFNRGEGLTRGSQYNGRSFVTLGFFFFCSTWR